MPSRLYQPLSIQFWQWLPVRLAFALLLVALLPAVILWPDNLLQHSFFITQRNSFIAACIGVCLVSYLLKKMTAFPGQRWFFTVIYTIFIAAVLIGISELLFRWPYSVKYLTLCLIIGVFFFFFSELILRRAKKRHYAVIPCGRCFAMPQVANVVWQQINSPTALNALNPSEILGVVADLGSPALDSAWQRELADTALRGIPIFHVLAVRESLTGQLPIKHLYENALGSLIPSPIYVFSKRVLDIAIVIIASPLALGLSAFTALGVALDGGGNVIFKQQRIGLGGRPFTMYKFRSMVKDSEKNGAQMASANDMRITRFGHFIRKTRLDEIPQFINVLKGDMSLIGPRPEQPSFVAAFNEQIPFYPYRHIVRPGITGWAQVMQGYASDVEETEKKVEYDFFYIKNFSFYLDLLIVLKTISILFTGRGAR